MACLWFVGCLNHLGFLESLEPPEETLGLNLVGKKELRRHADKQGRDVGKLAFCGVVFD